MNAEPEPSTSSGLRARPGPRSEERGFYFPRFGLRRVDDDERQPGARRLMDPSRDRARVEALLGDEEQRRALRHGRFTGLAGPGGLGGRAGERRRRHRRESI